MSYHMRRRIHACHMKRRRMPVQTDKISQKSAPQYLCHIKSLHGVHFRVSAWQEFRVQGLGFSEDTTCDTEIAWQSPAAQSFSIMIDVKGLGFRVQGLGFRVQLGHNLNQDRRQRLLRMRSIVCWCVFVRRAKCPQRPHRKVKEIQYTHKRDEHTHYQHC